MLRLTLYFDDQTAEKINGYAESGGVVQDTWSLAQIRARLASGRPEVVGHLAEMGNAFSTREKIRADLTEGLIRKTI